MRRGALAPLLAGGLLAACGGDLTTDLPDASTSPLAPDLYASELVDFSPGENAGYNDAKRPGVVLSAPTPPEAGSGSLDVLSLGVGGSIVLGFGDRTIVDGPGADFVVFENPFLTRDGFVFAELAEVAVSDDGFAWHTFECDPSDPAAGAWPGCAGWNPVSPFDVQKVSPLDPAVTGGDAFDLADLGVPMARFVRITDLSTEGEAPTAGFDLDAVGLVNFE